MKFLPAVLTGALLVGCGGGGGDVASRVGNGQPVLPDTQTIDGVLVMRHDSTAFDRAPKWTLDTTPLMVIGGRDGIEFTGGRSPVLLHDGRAAVLFSGRDAALMLFDSTGAPVRRLARRGHGPGELAGPMQINLLPDDTIVVADYANSSINWYVADSGLARTTRHDASWRIACFSMPSLLADGQLVALGYCQDPSGRTIQKVIPLARFPVDRSTVDTLRMVPHLGYRMVQHGGHAVAEYVRLSAIPSITTIDSTIVLASAVEGYTFELLDPDGATTGRIVVDGPPVPLTDSLKAAMIALRFKQIDEDADEPGVDPEGLKELARNAPYAEVLPPYEKVESGGDGLFWVIDRILPGDTTWAATAFRLDGAIVGRISSGALGDYPILFRPGRVVVRQTDEDGVVRYGVYQMVKEEG